MNDIENKIDELFNSLEKSDVFKDYVKIKKQLEEDKDINSLIEDIKRYQKILANNKDNSVEDKLKELYRKLETYPIYQSYLIVKDELSNELFVIKDVFEKYFDSILRF